MSRKLIYQCLLDTNSVTSPLGPWNVAACDAGLHSVKLSSEITNDNFLELGSENVTLKYKTQNDHIKKFEIWMKAYFNKATNKSSNNAIRLQSLLPRICEYIIPPKSGGKKITFRQRVWSILKEQVLFGETISYGALARLCSESGTSSAASRAVGGAMANNPISLVVPCHRVIKADGNTGNYSKCTKNNVKVWLLNHEK